ncbi:MAG: hypothetical protein JWL61_283 [Gemmatimonadetes bacterium]|nr:hypothetical protein [Gemmatimonadota bacterium]
MEREARLVISGLAMANGHVGQGVYARRIVEGLLRCHQDFPFRVVAPAGDDGLRRLVPAAKLVELDGRSPHRHELVSTVYWSNRIASHISRNYPEAVFHSPAPMWARHRPAHTVVTLHDCIYRHFPDYLGKRGVRRQLSRATERYAIGAKSVLTDSEFSRQDLATKAGIPSENLHVLYPWVDQRSFDPIAESTVTALRAKLQLPARFWLYLGGYDYRKNVEFLISAYASARREVPDIPPLVLAGTIPPLGHSALYCDVYGAIARTGLPDDAILLPGLIASADMPALYDLAELFVYPSLMEGFGLPPAEAMARGTPILASNTSSLPEVVRVPNCRFDPRDTAELRLKLVAAAADESQFRCALPDEFTEGFGIARYLQLIGLQSSVQSMQ